LLVLSANSAWNLVNFRRGLIRALLTGGYSIVALVPPDDANSGLEQMGISVRTVPMSPRGISPLSDLRLLLSYKKHFKDLRPAAFLGFTAKPNIYGSIAARRRRIPVIANVTGLGTGFLSGRMLEFVQSRLYRIALADATKVLFHNPEDRDLFLSNGLVKAARSEVIPGSGVDLEYFDVRPSAGNVEPVFLFIGRFLKDKGIVEFVEAARQVKKERPGVRLRALGSAEFHPRSVPAELVAQWQQEGVVEFLGSTDDVRPFIAQADCVVLPSYREGLPRALLEASAMAKAVIGSDVPGCRHVVDEEVTGFLCAPRSAPSLASVMIRFANLSPDRRVSMGLEARRRAERQFGEQRVIKSYIAALGTMLPEPRSNDNGLVL